jgi:hypothetical protein
MALCTPDMHQAILGIDAALRPLGGALILSDLFRSYDMQLQAHLDFVKKRKKAYSPPPGGSMHEAGRAFDLDLSRIRIPLKQFWDIAATFGVFPIISVPNSRLSEAWHFDCPGSHKLIYDYYKAGLGKNMTPYRAMAASAILALGIKVDSFGNKQKEVAIQAGLIRLGYRLGDLDGLIGSKTRTALSQAGIGFTNADSIMKEVEDRLSVKFPLEFSAPEPITMFNINDNRNAYF